MSTLTDWNPVLSREGSRAAALGLREELDETARRLLTQAFERVGADEGTLWLAGDGQLQPVFNTGPDAERILADFRQPLDRGVISMVYLSGQPFCENDVSTRGDHDQTIDRALKVTTTAMIAVPLFFAQDARGVLSCVRLNRSGTSEQEIFGAFSSSDLMEIQHTAEVLERLIDCSLLRRVLEG